MGKTESEKNNYCLGCSLAKKEIPVKVIYEDEFVTCILDHDPFNEGHALILPKKHFRFVDDFDAETLLSVLKSSQLISSTIRELYKPDGITICQNGGSFDDLSHYHMHVVPRFSNQDFSTFYQEEPWGNDDIKNKLDVTRKEMSEAIKKCFKL